MQIMTIKNCPVSISIGDSKLTLFSGSSTTLIILNIIQMRTTKQPHTQKYYWFQGNHLWNSSTMQSVWMLCEKKKKPTQVMNMNKQIKKNKEEGINLKQTLRPNANIWIEILFSREKAGGEMPFRWSVCREMQLRHFSERQSLSEDKWLN